MPEDGQSCNEAERGRNITEQVLNIQSNRIKAGRGDMIAARLAGVFGVHLDTDILSG
jgi:hypothetical protein